MVHFQESRFLGLSPRAVWLTLAVAGVVVGLFFMPPALKYLVEGSGKPKQKTASAVTVTSPAKKGDNASVEQKASLNPDKLQQVTSAIASQDHKEQIAKPQQQKKADAQDASSQKNGFFSGWNFRVKARTTVDGPGTAIPSGLTFDKLQSKEAQAFFKSGAADIKRFIKKEKVPAGRQTDAILLYSDAMSELAVGVKGVSNEEITKRLAALHAQTLRELSGAGADRGVLMTWLSLPIVSFVDDGTGVRAMQKIRNLFAPRMSLAAASVREKMPAMWGLGQGAVASANIQLVVRSSDVSTIRVMNNGQILRDIKLGNPDASGVRLVRISGDATGIWSFIAFDKFGARPYSKSYAFYPRVQGFPQNQNGTYDIAFEPGSARNSLDRFFLIGSSGGGRRTSDPMIAEF